LKRASSTVAVVVVALDHFNFSSDDDNTKEGRLLRGLQAGSSFVSL